jgi:hypothetical protein
MPGRVIGSMSSLMRGNYTAAMMMNGLARTALGVMGVVTGRIVGPVRRRMHLGRVTTPVVMRTVFNGRPHV